jgi:hypothetical protein
MFVFRGLVLFVAMFKPSEVSAIVVTVGAGVADPAICRFSSYQAGGEGHHHEYEQKGRENRLCCFHFSFVVSQIQWQSVSASLQE